MHKMLLTSITAGILALFLLSACAEDSKDADASAENVAVAEQAGTTGNKGGSVMDQPVDFSTPENFEKSMQKVREQEGDNAHNELKNALQYIKLYDLSVGNNTKRMHKKLDGKTPNEIILNMRG